jgi:hypothetical protein
MQDKDVVSPALQLPGRDGSHFAEVADRNNRNTWRQFQLGERTRPSCFQFVIGVYVAASGNRPLLAVFIRPNIQYNHFSFLLQPIL